MKLTTRNNNSKKHQTKAALKDLQARKEIKGRIVVIGHKGPNDFTIPGAPPMFGIGVTL